MLGNWVANPDNLRLLTKPLYGGGVVSRNKRSAVTAFLGRQFAEVIPHGLGALFHNLDPKAATVACPIPLRLSSSL
jgi:hypothetical protein